MKVQAIINRTTFLILLCSSQGMCTFRDGVSKSAGRQFRRQRRRQHCRGDGKGCRRRLRGNNEHMTEGETMNKEGGMGMGHHGGGGMGMGSHMEDIHNMVWNREKIDRVVNNTPDGVITTTTSDNSKVAEWIVGHVEEMKGRLDAGMRVRQWDPLFEAIFDNHDQITLDYEELKKDNGDSLGVKVDEAGNDAFAAVLVQAHADAITGFLANGREDMHKPHPIPKIAKD